MWGFDRGFDLYRRFSTRADLQAERVQRWLEWHRFHASRGHRYALALYDGEINFVDDNLGRVFRTLEDPTVMELVGQDPGAHLQGTSLRPYIEWIDKDTEEQLKALGYIE